MRLMFWIYARKITFRGRCLIEHPEMSMVVSNNIFFGGGQYDDYLIGLAGILCEKI